MNYVNSMAKHNGGTSWTRYSNYFLKNYNTTGVSLAFSPNVGVGGQEGITLISNRHVLIARHVALAKFTYPVQIYFVNNYNTVFTYTIDTALNVATIGTDSGPGYTDIAIGYLNTTVDPSLSFHKVVPSNFLSYLQNGPLISGNQFLSPFLPVLYMDGGDSDAECKRTWCGNLQSICNVCVSQILYYSVPRNGNKRNNCQPITGGDSGNIIFLPVNGEIVILGMWWTPGSGNIQQGDPLGGSSFIAPNINAINSAMTSLAGTSYSVTQADLSNFRFF